MIVRFNKQQSLSEFQEIIGKIYSVPDDRQYSLGDLLIQQQRFSMRALKGIRKEDKKSIQTNVLIALSWSMSISNRLHINLQEEVWKRFPNTCSYCGKRPCICKETKVEVRKKIKVSGGKRPQSILDLQKMFELIYPNNTRTLAEAGIHYAEEMGEVAEAIHNYLGTHETALFEETKIEMADYISCLFGVANSANINVAEELEKLFNKNCHVCHNLPCTCSFTSVAEYVV